ncbi:MAG TPA: polysaccharide biosynthesis/export family protein [Longimicrobiaceae bacterium]|nr:polysaccharide biosynthesis/export family protein [Longimicrobiaceae bacterium]
MPRAPLLLAVLAAALALPSPAPAQGPPADSAFVRPGDLVRLAVWQKPEFTGDFPVSSEGTIQHPLLADVRVVGVPRSVIRERIRTALLRYERDPPFVFDVLYRIAVGGEVRLPSLYSLGPETTLGQAVAAAGGVTEFARLDRVTLVRNGQETLLNLRAPAQANQHIRSGDEIRVARRGSVFSGYLSTLASIVGATAAILTLINTNN